MYNRDMYLRLLIGVAFVGLMGQLLIFPPNALSLGFIVSKIPTSITLTLLFHLVFSKWLWRLKYSYPLIVTVPNLHGTWTGTMKSSWINPMTSEECPEIDARVYIRQLFNSISVEVQTEKMTSVSYMASIVTNPYTGVQELCYLYTSRSFVEGRDNNPWHDGSTRLSIYSNDNFRLDGEYWTSRKTVGTIKLIRESTSIDRN